MEYSKAISNIQDGEVLADVKENGKERPWRWKKKAAIVMSEVYTLLGMTSKADRLAKCAEFIIMRSYIDGFLKFAGALFCRVRLCPICTMRRTEKIYSQVSAVMKYMNEHKVYKTYKYIFLTLTVRNVTGAELDGALDKLFDGFHKLLKRKEFMAMSKGWFRSLEITHNWESDTYHPHLHLIIAVDKKYFTEYENYVNHEAFKNVWRSCMNLDYDPWVYVEKVRPSGKVKVHDKKKPGNIVAELAKYTVKDEDYMILWVDESGEGKKKTHFSDMEDGPEKSKLYWKMAEVVKVLDPAMHKRRLAAFGGVMKTIHKLLNLDDPVDGELNAADEDPRAGMAYVDKVYGWQSGFGNYYLNRIEKQSKEKIEAPAPKDVNAARRKLEKKFGSSRKRKWVNNAFDGGIRPLSAE
jgi:plasmid rolling circle replication initiator protein Rep